MENALERNLGSNASVWISLLPKISNAPHLKHVISFFKYLPNINLNLEFSLLA